MSDEPTDRNDELSDDDEYRLTVMVGLKVPPGTVKRLKDLPKIKDGQERAAALEAILAEELGIDADHMSVLAASAAHIPPGDEVFLADKHRRMADLRAVHEVADQFFSASQQQQTH